MRNLSAIAALGRQTIVEWEDETPCCNSELPDDFEGLEDDFVTRMTLLGQGGTSLAWLARCRNYTLCAKVPRPRTSDREKQAMMRSARVQKGIQHVNVLCILGIQESSSHLCILLELASLGDVSRWQVRDVDAEAQWKVITDAAQGVHALHTASPPIVHRDLKGSNILLSKNMVAKVADFDFAAALPPPEFTTSGICGTPGYMAPEMLAGPEYGLAVDVFSFGSLMYEVTHQSFPFAKLIQQRNRVERAIDWYQACKRLTMQGARPMLDPAVCPKGMRQLIRECWRTDPSRRPTMAHIVERLDAMKDQFTEEYVLPDGADDDELLGGEGCFFVSGGGCAGGSVPYAVCRSERQLDSADQLYEQYQF